MGNLYNWHDERMNSLKTQEIHQELEHIHLLKEAGLSEPGILSRAVHALANWVKSRAQRRQEREQQSSHIGQPANGSGAKSS